MWQKHSSSPASESITSSTMDQSDLLRSNGKKPATAFGRRRYCGGTTAVTLLLFLLTNTVSILVSSGAVAGPSSFLRRYKPAAAGILPALWDDSAALLADLNATQAALAASRAELAGLYARVGTANELLRTLVDASQAQQQKVTAVAEAVDGWPREPAGELKLAIGLLHRRTVTTSEGTVLFPALGHACIRVQDDLERYMNYTPGGECPSDEALEHRLMLRGCDPLPRRRCRPRSPKGYVQPLPLPKSLWTMPPDTTVVWDDAYPCKNFSCLANAKGHAGSFDLRRGGRERSRWVRDDGALSFSIDAVLITRPNGTVRVGLDIGAPSSSGTFAARMRERGVTVVTATANSGAPFGGFVAARGLVPVLVGAEHRLPFFDGTLDIVHQFGGGEWMRDDVTLEFAMFDVYRVLRPGGLFWIDHFVCPGGGTKLNATFTPMIGRVGFKKLRWKTGRRGPDRNDEGYISALLEKPMT